MSYGALQSFADTELTSLKLALFCVQKVFCGDFKINYGLQCNQKG